jgi:hypothetical protein
MCPGHMHADWICAHELHPPAVENSELAADATTDHGLKCYVEAQQVLIHARLLL